MQNRGVIPLFISASRLGPNLCLYYPEDLRQTFIYWPRPPFSTPATELRMPPPRASVPVWADLHRATMHVAGAVASQRWDRPAQKRSLLRQHMAIEECGLRGGRSSTCVVVAARVSPRHRKQQMYRNLDLFFSHKWANEGRRRSAKNTQVGFWRRDQGSPAKLVYLLLNQQWWSFSVQGTKEGPSLLKLKELQPMLW